VKRRAYSPPTLSPLSFQSPRLAEGSGAGGSSDNPRYQESARPIVPEPIESARPIVLGPIESSQPIVLGPIESAQPIVPGGFPDDHESSISQISLAPRRTGTGSTIRAPSIAPSIHTPSIRAPSIHTPSHTPSTRAPSTARYSANELEAPRYRARTFSHSTLGDRPESPISVDGGNYHLDPHPRSLDRMSPVTLPPQMTLPPNNSAPTSFPTSSYQLPTPSSYQLPSYQRSADQRSAVRPSAPPFIVNRSAAANTSHMEGGNLSGQDDDVPRLPSVHLSSVSGVPSRCSRAVSSTTVVTPPASSSRNPATGPGPEVIRTDPLLGNLPGLFVGGNPARAERVMGNCE